MSKSDWVYVGHMLDLCKKGIQLSQGITRKEFDLSETLALALAHILQMIGEAAAHVSGEFRSAHPEIPWHEIIGTRHHIVHDYLNIDEDIVWATATVDIVNLHKLIQAIIPPDQE